MTNMHDIDRLTRAAHVQSAFGLRKTAHKYLGMAIDWPDSAERYRSEARRLLNYARWNLSQVRDMDARENVNGEA